MRRGPDAGTLLGRAVRTSAAGRGVGVAIGDADAVRWASATFTGARHTLTLEGEWSDAAADWLAGLADAELPLRGHLVADVVVRQVMREGERFVARIEALTVEEG